MDPRQLIGPASPLGSPAPFWFLELFKVLGFTLHQTAMHLWYAGVPLAAVLTVLGGPWAKTLRGRLLIAMPIVVAVGINLGVVPLLFTQVAYYQAFYPATVLIAWPWLLIILLLTLAYYGVYLAAISERQGWRPRIGATAAWVAAALFIAIGFTFANTFSLMTNLRGWSSLWARTSVAGAVTGLALNTADPTLLPRWLMLFGLALLTTAAFIAVDTAFLAGRRPVEYRRFAARAAALVGTVGLLVFAAMGTWYIFGRLSDSLVRAAAQRPLITAVFALAAGLPALTWITLILQRRGATRRGAAVAGVIQFAALGANATARQWVQNMELAPYLDVAAAPLRMQWSPLILFLMLFVAGLITVAWMLLRVVAANRAAAAS